MNSDTTVLYRPSPVAGSSRANKNDSSSPADAGDIFGRHRLSPLLFSPVIHIRSVNPVVQLKPDLTHGYRQGAQSPEIFSRRTALL